MIKMIKMVCAGFAGETPHEGEVAKETILNMFGDLFADIDNITANEFEAIEQRCIDNGWRGWLLSWKNWRENGFQEV